MYCYFCGSNKHTIVNCPKTCRGGMNRLHMYCTFCGGTDHNIKACPKTHPGNAARAWHPEKVKDHFVEDK